MNFISRQLSPSGGRDEKSALNQAFRIPLGWGIVVVAALFIVAIIASLVGAANIPAKGILLEILQPLVWFDLDSGLSDIQSTIIWQWRLPRVTLAVLVGASLSLAGATYQGVFRNPLADPYLLGAAAGAGLGATLAIVFQFPAILPLVDSVSLSAFAGSMIAITLSTALSRTAGRSTASLLLAGIAVAAFLTAWQTYFLQRYIDSIQEVYSWLIGNLSVAGWGKIQIILPYFLICLVVVFVHRRELDLLRLSEDEARSLGGNPRRSRLVLLIAASLLTATAVSVSGLIGFVGLVVPHLIRLTMGSSYRIIIPLSVFAGGAFLCLADLAARNIMAPAELPIGVITAFVGAPFFALVLHLSRTMIK